MKKSAAELEEVVRETSLSILQQHAHMTAEQFEDWAFRVLPDHMRRDLGLWSECGEIRFARNFADGETPEPELHLERPQVLKPNTPVRFRYGPKSKWLDGEYLGMSIAVAGLMVIHPLNGPGHAHIPADADHFAFRGD